MTTTFRLTPQITSVIDNTGDSNSVIPFLGNTSDTTPLLQGTAAANSMVYIYAHQRFIGMVESDNSGNWEYTPTLPLSYGGQAFSVMSQGQMSDPFVVIIQPLVVLPVNPEPTPSPDPVVIPEPVSPAKPAIAISHIQNQNSEQSAVAEGGKTDGNTVRISGTAQPHATVQIYANGREIAMINADAEGKWHFEPTLTTGDNLLKIASRGQWSEAFNIDVQPATTPIPEPEPTAPETPLPESGVILTLKAFDLPGTADFIANGDTTNNRKPILSGQAEPSSVVIIYSNDRVIGEAHTDSAGFWDYSPVLNDGENILRVALADGLQSSANFTLNVNAPISGILTIDQLYSPDGIILPGGFATTDSVVVSGTAEPFTTVELYLNGGFYGRADVAFNGK